MSKAIKIGLLLLFAVGAGSVFSQDNRPANAPTIGSVELYSPWIRTGEKTIGHSQELSGKRCFDLIRLEQKCNGPQALNYGNRFGVNWDIFDITGAQNSQTRMIDLGKYSWTDKLSLPEIEPWSKLGPGEKRAVTIDASGADGKPGARGADGGLGMNGDGTYSPVSTSRDPVSSKKAPAKKGMAEETVERQVSSTITMNGKIVRSDKYIPFNEVKKGNMYLARVVDTTHDHYVLLRVDDLIRGEKVTISFFKFHLPAARPVF